MIPLLELLRSLGFGALFGAGNAGLAYTVFPHLFEGAASLQDLLIVGGLIGGGHRAVDTYIIGAVLRPVSAFAAYYARLSNYDSRLAWASSAANRLPALSGRSP